jgi:hypothetical protein
MINKIFPRILNSSNDNRVRKKTEMKDAVNITVGDDYDGGYPAGDVGDGSEGDVGVIKPARGTTEVDLAAAYAINNIFQEDNLDIPQDYQRRVLGTVVDDRTDTVYIFVYSNVPQEIGVYAYDGSGYFGSEGNWRPIYTTPEFQWTEFTRVVGDVVHVSGGSEVDFRPMLYFTDDANEPRRLDVLYFIENGYTPEAVGFSYSPNDVHDKDLICACPRSPVHPPTFEFFTEPNRSASDFRRVPGVQFAYQCIYNSGEVSAISTYSDIAVPEEYLRQGTVIGSIDIPQLCRIRIQQIVDGAFAFSDEISSFKILVRRGNTGAFYEVDEIDRTGGVTFYDFYNDRVLSALTESEENKQFDNLPRIAQAITVAENRLFFGNYVEGYDEVPLEGLVQPRYVAGAVAGDTVELEAYPLMTNLSDTITRVGYDEVDPSAPIQERLPGVIIDTSTIPDVLPPNTTITASITFEPDGGYQLYTSVDGHHNSKFVGIAGQYNEAPFNQVFDSSMPFDAANSIDSSTFELNQGLPLIARGGGIGVGQNLEWHTTETVVDGQTIDRDVCIGNSAIGALRIDSAPVTFACEIVTTEIINNAPFQVARAVGAVMGQEPSAMPASFQILASNVAPAYSYDLGFEDPGGVTEGRLLKSQNTQQSIRIGNVSDRQRLGLITPVFKTSTTVTPAPCGYIIVNSATVQMRLVHQPSISFAGNIQQGCVLTLEVDTITNTDIRTCVPIVELPSLHLHSWRVYSGDFLEQNSITDVQLSDSDLNDGRYLFNNNQLPKLFSAVFWDLQDLSPNADFPYIVNSAPERRGVIGYLRSTGTTATQPLPTDLYRNNASRREEAVIPEGLPDTLQRSFINAIGTSMCDTEGAMVIQRGAFTNEVDYEADVSADTFNGLLYADYAKSITISGGGGYQYEGVVSSLMVMTGALIEHINTTRKVGLGAELNQNTAVQFALESQFFYNIWSDVSLYDFDFGLLITDNGNQPNETYWDMFLSVPEDNIMVASTHRASGLTYKSPAIYTGSDVPTYIATYRGQSSFTDNDEGTESSQVEIVYNVYLQEQGITAGFRSFKTSAFHDLGVVYYDDRGRPGNVNLLPRAYVGGYSGEQRGVSKGRVELQIDLLSNPPEWAHQYQIVYAGNSTYSDFIQYSIGGAFIDERGEVGVASDRPIYLSLNYLQHDQQVSYAQAFGAYHPDGSKEMYTFVPGDQVRVLYYEEVNGTVYPNNAVFDIIDQVLLTGNTTDIPEQALNPLDSGSSDTPLFLQGSFIVIRNNAESQGFNWQSVSTQGNEFLAGATYSNWNKNCIVEILRPRAVTDPDSRAYKETGLVFNVGRSNTGGAQGTPQGVYHQVPTIYMQNGDVWWRRVPVNLKPYDEDGGYYESLIPSSQTDEEGTDIDPTYQPRFRNVYLECRSFTDTFPSANVNGFGKEKFFFPDSAEVRRDSTITYSDRNQYSTLRVKYGSFNPYQLPFTDLPNQYGGINALVAFNEYILVIQENKSSILPINRSILSDASGGNQLISSDKIIGKQQFIKGEYGADNNRESVIKVEDHVYFAHKTRGEVYRYGGGKVEVISRKGVSGFLYDSFQDNLNDADVMRVVSGYDALKDEYILSIINIDAVPQYFSINPFTQPLLDTFVFDPFGDVTADGTTFEDVGGSGGGVIPDIAGDEDWDNGYEDPMDSDVDDIVDTGGTAPDGVAPGVWNPNDTGKPVIELESGNADYLKRFAQGVDPEPNGGGIIFDAEAIRTHVVSQLSDDVTSFTPTPINLDSVVPRTVGDIILRAGQAPATGRLLLKTEPNEQQQVYWNLNTNSIEPGSGFESDVQFLFFMTLQPIFDALDYSSLETNPGNYNSVYLNYLDSNVVRSLRGQILAYSYAFTDSKAQLISTLKTSAEQSIVTRTNEEIPALFSDIQSDLNAAELLGNATLSNLLDQAQVAHLALQDFVTNDLDGNNTTAVEFIDDEIDTKVADGFGVFAVEDYPLNDFAIFSLNNIKTLTANIGDYVRPLLTLEDVDVTSLVAGLGNNLANLRSQLDVVTSQVQNLSSVPIDLGADEFVPGVVINQLQDRALETLAGADGVLTRDDIVLKPDIFLQLQTILDLFGNNGVEIDADLVKEVLATYISVNPSVAELPPTFYGQNRTLLQNINGINRLYENRTDINGNFVTGSGDILEVLSKFGGSATWNELNQEEFDDLMNTIAEQVLIYINANA